MSHLEDQVVLVTGCSSGIGRALVKEFARRGHRAFASARRLEAIADLKSDRLDTVELDVTDAGSIDRAVTQVTERAGRVDIVVNNAGFNVFGPLAEVPIERVKSLFDTNVTAPLALVQRLFPAMATRRSGRIVNIGSVVGELPTPFAGAYCASKAALHMLSDVLRMEVSPFGIDVIVVAPAGVRSNIAEAGSVGLEQYARPESRYHAVHHQIEKRAKASQVDPMDTDVFAARVVDLVTRRTPPRVVRLGNGAALFTTLGRLPRPMQDRMMQRRFGLNGLGRSSA
jgi:NAD(P)-dependent dehydrogenase (short-subunit alcohol dehydrogenase family)